mmetsp:Transcript_118793/g.236636  ORF Transcript_118793/g.236636 Transcript_118793/m.236636 type:complete len:277 (-) Transcript_118793:106-936(-)
MAAWVELPANHGLLRPPLRHVRIGLSRWDQRQRCCYQDGSLLEADVGISWAAAAVACVVNARRLQVASILRPRHGCPSRRMAEAAAPAAGEFNSEGSTAAAAAGPATPRSRFALWWQKNGRFDRKRIQEMGVTCFLAYGFLANLIAVFLIVFSAYSAMSATGLSPLADRVALRRFGLTYAGLYVVSCLARPLRFAFAVAASRPLEIAMQRMSRRLKCEKTVAILMTVFIFNILTILVLFCGLRFASVTTGVPLDIRHIGMLLRAGKEASHAPAAGA